MLFIVKFKFEFFKSKIIKPNSDLSDSDLSNSDLSDSDLSDSDLSDSDLSDSDLSDSDMADSDNYYPDKADSDKYYSDLHEYDTNNAIYITGLWELHKNLVNSCLVSKREFCSKLIENAKKDPRYGELRKEFKVNILKAKNSQLECLIKHFNRAMFEIMRHILSVLINKSERTVIPLTQWDIDYKFRLVEKLHKQAEELEEDHYLTLDWIKNTDQKWCNRASFHDIENQHELAMSDLQKLINHENDRKYSDYCYNLDVSELKKIENKIRIYGINPGLR